MSIIQLKGYILVPESDLEAVKAELANHITLTREEEGCLLFEVSQDTRNSNRFSVFEKFTNKKTFELHQLRVKNSIWGSLSKNVERHYEITTIE